MTRLKTLTKRNGTLNVKYYEELNRLETVLIDMERASSLASAITIVHREMGWQEVESLLYLLDDLIKQVDKDFQERFQTLWNVIKEDTHEKPKKGKDKK